MMQEDIQLYNADDNVLKTFNRFFPDANISMGTYGRKVMLLMMALSNLTQSKWANYTVYFESSSSCKSILVSGETVFVVPHTKVSDSNLTSVKTVVRSLFNKDKLVKGHYTKYVANVDTTIGSFDVIKTIYNDKRSKGSTILYSVVVESKLKGLKKLLPFNNIKTYRADPIEVINCTIEQQDNEPRSIGLMSRDILDLTMALTEQ